MFSNLSEKLIGVLGALTRKGFLKEDDVISAMREVRVILLEADVALPVVKSFIEETTNRAIGENIIRSVTPGQMVVKIVHDSLVNLLTSKSNQDTQLNFNSTSPSAFLVVGLQGSGKTTTVAKIGRFLQEKHKKKVLMASLDVYRPAAIEQLAVLGKESGLLTLDKEDKQKPLYIAHRAMKEASKSGCDLVLLDTAGRTTVDKELMDEVYDISQAISPVEKLLVADSLMGQNAASVAKAFDEKLQLTGIALTRIDGDSRGGAALSISAVTGLPIKLLGVGETTDAIEMFDPERIANRILGMGDIVNLVEKASDSVKKEEAKLLNDKIRKGKFDFDDLLIQIRQIKRLGGAKSLIDALPSLVGKSKNIKNMNLDQSVLNRQEAIILSMTLQERRQPNLIKASRKKRIALGSGTAVTDVNRVLKQFKQMSVMMKKMQKGGLPNLPGGMGNFGF